MNVNPPPPPPIFNRPYTSAVEAYAVQPAVAAALQSAGVARTQTVQAPAPVAKAEAPRRAVTSTETGQSVDTTAQALSAKSNGKYQGRGQLVDLRA
jgi:predicted deacylase